MNAFTIDLEDWFHICGVGGALAADNWERLPSRVELTTRLLLDDLDRAGVRATCFVLGWIAERYPRLVDEVRAAGHTLGSHGHTHTRVFELTPETLEAELTRSRDALHAIAGEPVTAFRAPEWSLNPRVPWGFDRLLATGYTLDASMAPLKIVGQVDYPRAPHLRRVGERTLVEVPPFVADRYGQVVPMGWGWGLRMSRPSRVAREIERANRMGQPAVLTVHPWEIDPNPPRVRLPARQHFAHYFRLGGFRTRLREVLRGVPFTSLAHVAATARPL
jgi:polysaccharide deacetylase family protein (PEP-CTERM system associated)